MTGALTPGAGGPDLCRWGHTPPPVPGGSPRTRAPGVLVLVSGPRPPTQGVSAPPMPGHEPPALRVALGSEGTGGRLGALAPRAGAQAPAAWGTSPSVGGCTPILEAHPLCLGLRPPRLGVTTPAAGGDPFAQGKAPGIGAYYPPLRLEVSPLALGAKGAPPSQPLATPGRLWSLSPHAPPKALPVPAVNA